MANLQLANQAEKRKQETLRMEQQQSNPFLNQDEEENTSLKSAERCSSLICYCV